MTRMSTTDIKKRRKKKARLKKKLVCRFCPRPIYVDYKDLKTLRLMVSRTSTIIGRRRTGSCAKYQRAVKEAVLRARFMALLPYVPEE